MVSETRINYNGIENIQKAAKALIDHFNPRAHARYWSLCEDCVLLAERLKEAASVERGSDGG